MHFACLLFSKLVPATSNHGVNTCPSPVYWPSLALLFHRASMAVPFSPKPVFRSIAGILAGWGVQRGIFHSQDPTNTWWECLWGFFATKTMLLNAVRTKITESREMYTYYVCIYGSIYIYIYIYKWCSGLPWRPDIFNSSHHPSTLGLLLVTDTHADTYAP